MTLGDLHMAVQAAMGWENSHLHLFLVGGEQIGDPRQLDEVADEARVTVGELAGRGLKSFAYVYDMGDDWEHAIAIEGSEPIEPGRAYPACVGGKRACPPEDSGGPWGFADMLEAVADPEARAARGGRGMARGVRPGGLLGRGGGGAGAGVVRAEADAQAAGEAVSVVRWREGGKVGARGLPDEIHGLGGRM